MSKKITLKKFWESKDKLAINCETHEQSMKLLKAFDKMGKKWKNESSYLNKDRWPYFKKEICYANTNTFGSIAAHQELGYKILKFDDIDMIDSIN